MKHATTVLVTIAAVFLLSACSDDGTAETSGESIGKAIDSAAQEVSDALES